MEKVYIIWCPFSRAIKCFSKVPSSEYYAAVYYLVL